MSSSTHRAFTNCTKASTILQAIPLLRSNPQHIGYSSFKRLSLACLTNHSNGRTAEDLCFSSRVVSSNYRAWNVFERREASLSQLKLSKDLKRFSPSFNTHFSREKDS